MTVTAPSLNPTDGARPPTRPVGRLGCRLVELARVLHHDQYQLVITAAALADSGEWAAEGATSAVAWLAATADVEAVTAHGTGGTGPLGPSTQSGLCAAMAGWRNRHHSGAEIDSYHHQQRSLRVRTDCDGMITFTIRPPPHLSATLIALLTTIMWNTKPAETRRHCAKLGSTTPRAGLSTPRPGDASPPHGKEGWLS